MTMVDSGSSLLQRIQARLNGDKENQIVFEDDSDNESESDVDDNITLDECVDVVKRKSRDKNSSFTKIIQLTTNNSSSSSRINEKSNLKEVLSRKIAQRQSKASTGESLSKTATSTTTSSVTINAPALGEEGLQQDSNPIIRHLASNFREDSQNTVSGGDSQNTINGGESQNTISGGDSQSQYVDDDSESTIPVKKKKSRLTNEEKERRERERLEKKRKLQDEKLAKQKKREEAKLEKELEKEKLKADKKASTLNKRSERKDECLEKIVAIVDPSMIEGANGADILKGLQDICVRYEIKSLPIPSCIGWLKENATFSVNGKSEVSKSVEFEEEAHILHKLTANELAVRVSNELVGESESEETIGGLVREMKKSFSNKKITIVVTGLNAYYRLFKTKTNRQFRAQALGYDEQAGKRKRKKDEVVPVLEHDEIEGMLIQLQTFHDGLFIRKCEDVKNLSEFVNSFTRSIAEAPFKKVSNASLQFCALAPGDKQSIKVLDNGTGILPLWNQQLQQFYGVRHETSVAITQHYPTPRSLMEAYQQETPQTAPFLLEDIEVRRGVGVLQTSRRVGPEISKRIHKLMTSTNGEEPLAR